MRSLSSVVAFNLQCLRWVNNNLVFGSLENNTVYRDIFAPVLFLPLSPSLSQGQCLKVSLFKRNRSGRIQDWAKVFASVEGQRLHWAKTTLYPIWSAFLYKCNDRWYACLALHVFRNCSEILERNWGSHPNKICWKHLRLTI